MDEPIPLNIRTRIIQGMHDQDVPWQRTMQLAEKVESNDVYITFIKDGEHRLAREQDLALLQHALQGCFEKYKRECLYSCVSNSFI